MMNRHYTLLDRLCLGLDQAARALFDNPKTSGAAYPGQHVPEAALGEVQRKHAAALMRINHAGEICAQALYHGQGIVSRSCAVQAKMQQAAREEGDHLAWCKRRLDELHSHTSYLNPLWYAGSFCIGMIAGVVGDAVSLGFVAETENQVIRHLQGHLHTLPAEDQRSHAILQKMQTDETKHREEAVNLGARELPWPIKKAMGFTSRIMVGTAYWL